MTRKIEVVDPRSIREFFARTGGDVYSRMEQAAPSLATGMLPSAAVAVMQRAMALSHLLRARPDLRDTYSEKALIAATALCELIEPPMSLVEADEAAFDPETFEKEAARAEL